MAQLNPMLVELQKKIQDYNKNVGIIIDKVAREQNKWTIGFVVLNIVIFALLEIGASKLPTLVPGISNTIWSFVITLLLLLVELPMASKKGKEGLQELQLNENVITPKMNYAGEWEYKTDFRVQSPDDGTDEYKRFKANMEDYKERGTSVWTQDVFELKIDFANTTSKDDQPQVIWHSNPISYDDRQVSWSFGGKIWWKDDKNYANEFSGIEQYTVKKKDAMGRPCRLEGHLVGTILVGERFYVVDAVSKFTRKI